MLSASSLHLSSCHICLHSSPPNPFYAFRWCPQCNSLPSRSIPFRALPAKEDDLLDETMHVKAHLIFFNYRGRRQVFTLTRSSPSRSTHVVSLQPEVLITIKMRLIWKHMGAIQSIATPSSSQASAPCDPGCG